MTKTRFRYRNLHSAIFRSLQHWLAQTKKKLWKVLLSNSISIRRSTLLLLPSDLLHSVMLTDGLSPLLVEQTLIVLFGDLSFTMCSFSMTCVQTRRCILDGWLERRVLIWQCESLLWSFTPQLRKLSTRIAPGLHGEWLTAYIAINETTDSLRRVNEYYVLSVLHAELKYSELALS